MFGANAFSGFSVSDLAAAKEFYRTKLGLPVEEQPGMGFQIKFENGHTVFVYDKADHQPATYTVLNFPVADINAAVDELSGKGVTMETYDNMPAPQDDKGILRGLSSSYGPDIAWFKDPAGNILAVLQES